MIELRRVGKIVNAHVTTAGVKSSSSESVQIVATHKKLL